MDVPVFGLFKNSVRKMITEELIADATGDLYSISKPAAIRIASSCWLVDAFSKNVVSGFRSTGLWPILHGQMMKRFLLFQDGGVPESFVQAAWIERRQTFGAELLSLPAKSKKGKRRKTIDVGERILTMSLLDNIDKSVRERRESAKRKKDLQAKRARKRTAKKTEANHSAHTKRALTTARKTTKRRQNKAANCLP
ncbi:hypothetical protein Ae201684P_007098 [Aphanomyces euteiches]|uniref:DDE-1 domain-containing protein n=1 Tax=Aphanomyces euteiches TaxID=100861 RepID=A0A6G0X891_9STRA|nr:hypothetical protein Ae201684_007316 [Aphanomyces euteiches]KAH9100907.1 hypothetical protein Ae201684P_007098 [Aphanomyces euteiches]